MSSHLVVKAGPGTVGKHPCTYEVEHKRPPREPTERCTHQPAALCILTKDADQSCRGNSSGLKKELRLACSLSPREAETESQLQDKSEMSLVELVMLNRVSGRARNQREKPPLSTVWSPLDAEGFQEC